MIIISIMDLIEIDIAKLNKYITITPSMKSKKKRKKKQNNINNISKSFFLNDGIIRYDIKIKIGRAHV